jgi:hypothetical protein
MVEEDGAEFVEMHLGFCINGLDQLIFFHGLKDVEASALLGYSL